MGRRPRSAGGSKPIPVANGLAAAVPNEVASPRPSPFDLLVEALQSTFPEGFGGAPPRFIALEVWALAHGLATLSASGHLPRAAGMPDKYELLRAGVLALVHGAASGGRPRE